VEEISLTLMKMAWSFGVRMFLSLSLFMSWSSIWLGVGDQGIPSICSESTCIHPTRTGFASADIRFDVMVYLQGGQRSTQDVDITVASYVDDLKAILLAEHRYAGIAATSGCAS